MQPTVSEASSRSASRPANAPASLGKHRLSKPQRASIGRAKSEQRLRTARELVLALQVDLRQRDEQLVLLRHIIASLQEELDSRGILRASHEDVGDPLVFDLFDTADAQEVSVQTEISVCHGCPDVFISAQQLAVATRPHSLTTSSEVEHASDDVNAIGAVVTYELPHSLTPDGEVEHASVDVNATSAYVVAPGLPHPLTMHSEVEHASYDVNATCAVVAASGFVTAGCADAAAGSHPGHAATSAQLSRVGNSRSALDKPLATSGGEAVASPAPGLRTSHPGPLENGGGTSVTTLDNGTHPESCVAGTTQCVVSAVLHGSPGPGCLPCPSPGGEAVASPAPGTTGDDTTMVGEVVGDDLHTASGKGFSDAPGLDAQDIMPNLTPLLRTEAPIALWLPVHCHTAALASTDFPDTMYRSCFAFPCKRQHLRRMGWSQKVSYYYMGIQQANHPNVGHHVPLHILVELWRRKCDLQPHLCTRRQLRALCYALETVDLQQFDEEFWEHVTGVHSDDYSRGQQLVLGFSYVLQALGIVISRVLH